MAGGGQRCACQNVFGDLADGWKYTLYAKHVREANDDPLFVKVTEPPPASFEDCLRTLAMINKMMFDIARKDSLSPLLMTVPGVGPATAPRVTCLLRSCPASSYRNRWRHGVRAVALQAVQWRG